MCGFEFWIIDLDQWFVVNDVVGCVVVWYGNYCQIDCVFFQVFDELWCWFVDDFDDCLWMLV